MSLYQKITMDLKELDFIKELYRFQGATSFDHFDFRTSRFTDNKSDYVYFSESLDHHKYFTNKRIRQFLNRIVLIDTPYLISCYDLRDNEEHYNYIKNLVLNTDKISEMYSIRLSCNRQASILIASNCTYQTNKKEKKGIERVDRRVYGGGYGLAEEWKNMLTYLTYFNSYLKIDRRAILQLLSNMRRTGRVNNKDNISFLLNNRSNYHVELNPSLESDFTKYQIMDSLETIIDKELYLPNSELGKKPTKTIKAVVDDYEKGKRKVLSLLNNY